MTWTYDNNPGTADAAQRRDAVRLLVGDNDQTDQQTSDEEIAFNLSEQGDNVYEAAALTAWQLSGKYSRQADLSYDSVKESLSQKSKQYLELATRLERRADKSSGMGVPSAGGVSIDAMDDADDDTDRPEPAFERGQFRHPPGRRRGAEDWFDYHK